MEIAKLHNTAELKIPIIVRRSKIDGPVVLFSAEFMVMKLMVLRLYDNLSLKKLINLQEEPSFVYPLTFLVLIKK
jgi:hypothetical protein